MASHMLAGVCVADTCESVDDTSVACDGDGDEDRMELNMVWAGPTLQTVPI